MPHRPPGALRFEVSGEVWLVAVSAVVVVVVAAAAAVVVPVVVVVVVLRLGQPGHIPHVGAVHRIASSEEEENANLTMRDRRKDYEFR